MKECKDDTVDSGHGYIKTWRSCPKCKFSLFENYNGDRKCMINADCDYISLKEVRELRILDD